MSLRIGVFLCHCGSNIGGVVRIKEVLEHVKTLPDVAYAEDNIYTCSKEGLDSIREAIAEHGLNRVVVASCTPRTHEPLFKANCEKAGLNKYLFEFVNLREHCSWVHMREADKATEKAKGLVAMGVAKARLLEPQEEEEIPVNGSAIVIGGGIAGMTAASALGHQGFQVHLIEREPALGGTVRHLYTLFPTNQDAQELLASLRDEIQAQDNVHVHLGAEVTEVSGYVGNFDVSLTDGATFQAGTVIIATGGREMKPKDGKKDNVITQLELEAQLKAGRNYDKVVMIQCVGWDDAHKGEDTVNYCSRSCCMAAIKNALLLKEKSPETQVYVLYRELMTYGVDFEQSLKDAMKRGVRFLRYSAADPPEVVGNGVATAVKVRTTEREVTLPADCVVLTVPFVPALGREDISKMLKVPLNAEGFFLEAHVKLRPVEFSTDGVFLCGTARAPACIPECVLQGFAAASKASSLMAKGTIRAEAINAWVNEELCSGCATCVDLCPYHAITMTEGPAGPKAHVNAVQCKGCGTCCAACPSGSMQQKGFTDSQILEMIGAALPVGK